MKQSDWQDEAALVAFEENLRADPFAPPEVIAKRSFDQVRSLFRERGHFIAENKSDKPRSANNNGVRFARRRE